MILLIFCVSDRQEICIYIPESF